jgi:hypothetical protein
MFKIQRREKEAFLAAEQRAFEERVVRMLRASWKKTFEAEGEAAVRAFVATWAAEATERGFREDREAAHLLHVAVALTHDFGQDPRRVSWFAEVSADRKLAPAARVYRLYGHLYKAYDALEREQRRKEKA